MKDWITTKMNDSGEEILDWDAIQQSVPNVAITDNLKSEMYAAPIVPQKSDIPVSLPSPQGDKWTKSGLSARGTRSRMSTAGSGYQLLDKEEEEEEDVQAKEEEQKEDTSKAALIAALFAGVSSSSNNEKEEVTSNRWSKSLVKFLIFTSISTLTLTCSLATYEINNKSEHHISGASYPQHRSNQKIVYNIFIKVQIKYLHFSA